MTENDVHGGGRRPVAWGEKLVANNGLSYIWINEFELILHGVDDVIRCCQGYC